MTRLALLGALLAHAIAGVANAQTTPEEARAEGRAMAREKRADPTLVPTDEALARGVPGYDGTVLPQSALFGDPDRIAAEGSRAAGGSESWRTVTDAERTRPRFSGAEIEAATARARAVESDPSVYLAGENLTGETGTCVPLPPGTGDAGHYEAICHSGTRVTQSTPACRAPLVVEVEQASRWQYECRTGRMRREGGRVTLCSAFDPQVEDGTCHETSRTLVGQDCLQGAWPDCTEPGEIVYELTMSCTREVPGQTGQEVSEPRIVSERRDESACQAATAGLTCELASETCVDADPPMRLIDGLAVTRACWNWERSHRCHAFAGANDCAELEANAQCRYLRTDCLDDPRDGPCRVAEQVYGCPIPGSVASSDRQYICGGDVYCINGSCETVVREASTELKDALVALHAIGQAGDEFEPDSLSLFSGARESCHKPVFGLVNCCAGKVSGLLTAAAGGAALAGGPAAIAALATPFLTLFLCSQEEKMLDIKDRMGFCHKLGSYCSGDFLGICHTRRTAHCCFESKLSRILQEQGRPQLGKAWGAPKTEACRGFTVDEFAQLDLSRMDFTEIYADFLDAAKLPDEAQALADIQAKIDAYYRLHGS